MNNGFCSNTPSALRPERRMCAVNMCNFRGDENGRTNAAIRRRAMADQPQKVPCRCGGSGSRRLDANLVLLAGGARRMERIAATTGPEAPGFWRDCPRVLFLR